MKIVRNIVLHCLFSISILSDQKFELRFGHQTLLVRGLEKSSDFYLNIVGFKEIGDDTGLEQIGWFF